MEEKKWWAWLVLTGSIVALVLLISSPMGYQGEWLPLGQALLGTLVSLLTALLCLIVGVVMAIVAHRKSLPINRNILLIGVVLSLVPVSVMAPQFIAGRSVPPIHDISTDTVNPPEFEAVVKLRADAPNSLEYEPGGEVAQQQIAAYPQIKPLVSDLEVGAALERAEQLILEQGMELVGRNDDAGMLEATATTRWFGFKDDLVVRVRAQGAGSVIDVRSVSRVGQSDLGANAARIEKLLTSF